VPGVVVRVRFANRRQLKQAFLREISKGRMFLHTDTPLQTRERVPIVLELPDGDTVDLVGEVMQTMPPAVATPGRPAAMPVRFLDFTTTKRVLIEDFINRSRTNLPASAPEHRPTPAIPMPAMENLVRALRRLVWLSGDARNFGDVDYYQILGLPE